MVVWWCTVNHFLGVSPRRHQSPPCSSSDDDRVGRRRRRSGADFWGEGEMVLTAAQFDVWGRRSPQFQPSSLLSDSVVVAPRTSTHALKWSDGVASRRTLQHCVCACEVAWRIAGRFFTPATTSVLFLLVSLRGTHVCSQRTFMQYLSSDKQSSTMARPVAIFLDTAQTLGRSRVGRHPRQSHPLSSTPV